MERGSVGVAWRPHLGFVWMTSVRDLAWRRRRFAISVLGTSLVFAISLLLSGFLAHFDREIDATLDALGAHAYVVPEHVAGPLTSMAPFAAASVGSLLADESAAPLVTALQTATLDPPINVFLVGFEDEALGAPALWRGSLPKAPGQAVVDSSVGLDVGETIIVGEETLDIVGLTRGLTVLGTIPDVFVSLSDAQRLVFRGAPLITAVALDATLEDIPAGFALHSRRDAADDLRRPLTDTIASIELFRTLLWIVAAAIIGSVLYLSALERSGDFAVFKATGTDTVDVVAGLILQAITLAVTASVLSIGLAYLLAPLFPAGVAFPARLLAGVPVVAVTVALIGSVAGVRRTLAVDPALAFGGA